MLKISTRKSLNVLYKNKKVGTLAETKDKKIAFAYDKEWLETGFSISPFSLPLKENIFLPTKHYFDGLFGVFADSLPDAWGRLLMNRFLMEKGFDYENMAILNQLSLVGDSGMGALCYHPATKETIQPSESNLDLLAEECKQILNAHPIKNLDTLYRLGGTSGGARPKIMTEIEGKNWLIKFPAHIDPKNIGEMEYEYSICAKACGIHMTETRLFPSDICSGYFGTVRFDRSFISTPSLRPHENKKENRYHILTAAALLETDYEQPSLDYNSLMKLTRLITDECKEDIENMYLRMCFNVLAHNRDDHAKNFSYLYDDIENRWRLAPAYDLTYSNTYFGEHTTSVDGNGKNPGQTEIFHVGMTAGIGKKRCMELYQIVKTCVDEKLQKYLEGGSQ